MADSASESDSSLADGPSMMPPSPVTKEKWQKRMESIQQQNRVVKAELDTYKLRVKSLQEENRALRQASVNIQARAEQEEEYISNTLLKKIQTLKKEKETLALNYEQEEECLTNDLSRKLTQLRQEKVELEQTLVQESECLVSKLLRKISKLEAETKTKQNDLETLRREKIELENTLEQEQEALVNKLWKRMDKLEAEKRLLQEKLEQPISNPPSPAEFNQGDRADNLSSHIENLRGEVTKLRAQLSTSQQQHNRNLQHFAHEERLVREENLRLQRKLQMEVERREALCRHLSESESSLEMEEERQYNELSSRHRTVSSPGPFNVSPNSSRPLSPGVGSLGSRSDLYPSCSALYLHSRCTTCGQPLHHALIPSSAASPPPSMYGRISTNRQSQERFIKPIAPPQSTNTQASVNSTVTPLNSASTTTVSNHTSPRSCSSPIARNVRSPSPQMAAPPSPMDVTKN